jgi:integrase
MQIPAPEPLPRELGDGEIMALIAYASDDLRLAIVGLLHGLAPEEVVALRWDQIDFDGQSIDVGGAFARSVPLQQPGAILLAQSRRNAPDPALLLRNSRGEPLNVDDLNRLVLFGAYDAGLDRPPEVTAATVRRAYLVFLLRQGVRAADIERIAGHVPQDEMVAHMQVASARMRLPLEHIDTLHPVLRTLAGSAGA